MAWLLLGLATQGQRGPQRAIATQTEGKMTEAHGSFEVKMTPTTGMVADGIAGTTLTKTYAGDLQGTAAGQMFSAGDPQLRNAGYVAIERVTGALGGRSGSFALMQLGTMATGSAPALRAEIAPGSGTGELAGISGTMTIEVAGGHRYVLRYALVP